VWGRERKGSGELSITLPLVGIPESGIFQRNFSPYIPQWNPGTKYLRVLIFGLLGYAVFYKDETRYGVCPYADQRGNLCFIVCVKVSEFCVIL